MDKLFFSNLLLSFTGDKDTGAFTGALQVLFLGAIIFPGSTVSTKIEMTRMASYLIETDQN